MRRLQIILLLGGILTVTNHIIAAMSPFTTHPENTWVKQSPREGVAAPGFYYEGSGAFDPFSNQWIHHAGHDGIPQGFHTFTCDLASGGSRGHPSPR